MSDKGWVDGVISQLAGAVDGVLEVQINGQPIFAHIDSDMIDFFKDNKSFLIRLGKDVFRSFLVLMNEKRDEDALNLLITKMDADDLIARLEMDASALHQDNAQRDQFLSKLLAFAEKLAMAIATRAIIALLF